MNAEEDFKLAERYERIYARLKDDPAFDGVNDYYLRDFVYAKTIAEAAVEKFLKLIVQKFVLKFVELLTEYQRRGYPYGKTRRGRKKWIRLQMKKINLKKLVREN